MRGRKQLSSNSCSGLVFPRPSADPDLKATSPRGAVCSGTAPPQPHRCHQSPPQHLLWLQSQLKEGGQRPAAAGDGGSSAGAIDRPPPSSSRSRRRLSAGATKQQRNRHFYGSKSPVGAGPSSHTRCRGWPRVRLLPSYRRPGVGGTCPCEDCAATQRLRYRQFCAS